MLVGQADPKPTWLPTSLASGGFYQRGTCSEEVGGSSSSRLFSRTPGPGPDQNSKDNSPTLFPKQKVGGRLNLSLFSSVRQTGFSKGQQVKGQVGMMSTGFNNRNDKLAALMKVANAFEQTLAPRSSVRMLSMKGSEDLETENSSEDKVAKGFDVKTDFEKEENKAELDMTLGKEKVDGALVRKNELIGKLSDSNDQGDRAFAMLLELGMVDIHLDPDDPLYDHDHDALYAPENNWL